MNKEYQYWSRILNEHLDEGDAGATVTVSQTVSVLPRGDGSPTPTFDEGSIFHIDAASLSIDGTHGRNKQTLNVAWDRISSITFSYHGVPKNG
jgi:hypothetical protein